MADPNILQHGGDALANVVRRTTDTDEGDPIGPQLSGDARLRPSRRIVEIRFGDKHRPGLRRTSVDFQKRSTG